MIVDCLIVDSVVVVDVVDVVDGGASSCEGSVSGNSPLLQHLWWEKAGSVNLAAVVTKYCDQKWSHKGGIHLHFDSSFLADPTKEPGHTCKHTRSVSRIGQR